MIRCHPFAPVISLSKSFGFKLPKNVIVDKSKSVQESLSQVDCVVYTWSTVAVEALKAGVPVMYLDILRPLYVDPLFACVHLKCTVSRPDEMVPTLKELYKMDDETFAAEQQQAQEYLKEYFYPVTEERMEMFLPNERIL